MKTELLGIILMFGLSVLLAIPLGRYIGKVFNYEKTWLDRFFNPLDQVIYRLAGIRPQNRKKSETQPYRALPHNAVWVVNSIGLR